MTVKLSGQRGYNGSACKNGDDAVGSPLVDEPPANGRSEIINTKDPRFSDFIKDARLHNLKSPETPEVKSQISSKIDACATSETCIVLQCVVPSSTPPKGRPGGSGQAGGIGGNGGNNGLLVIRSQEDPTTLLRDHIAIAKGANGLPLVAMGGAMGPGGRGGKGGDPGIGGKDDPSQICPKAPAGEKGDFGSDGPTGALGPTPSDGRPGSAIDPVISRLFLRDYFGRTLN
jgi:hypothetical protein